MEHADPAARPDDPLIDVVADCLRRIDEEGEVALAAVCAAHAGDADEIRRRIERLRSVGLDGTGDGVGVFRALREHGRYTPVRELGRGGMGIVLLVRDARTGREVALKLLGHGSERGRARFLREVRAGAQLDHPNVVPVYDVGELGDRPYFTMQHVDGEPLSAILSRLRDAGIPPHELTPAELRSSAPSWIAAAGRLVADLAHALEHAHERGVVHRDVKPSNVLVRGDGNALLCDFGLARVEGDGALTRTGDLAGTPHYVSPEQAAGAELDGRTDVFSLGATLYELLTLARAFPGVSSQEVLRAVSSREPPRAGELHRGLPRDLETICHTALEKDPRRRYSSARGIADDLERFLAFRPIQARPVGPLARAWRAARRRPATAIALLLAVVIAVGAPVGLLAANRAIAGEASLARETARQKAEVVDFYTDVLAEAHPDFLGANATVVAALERASRGLGERFADDPEVEAELRRTLGLTYLGLELTDDALPHLERLCELLADEGRERIQAQVFLGWTLAAAQDFPAAETVLEEALAQARRRLADDDELLAELLDALAGAAFGRGDVAGAEARAREAVERLRASVPDHTKIASVELRHGHYLAALGRLDEAEAAYRASIDRAEAAGNAEVLVLEAASAYGSLLARTGRADEAAELQWAGIDSAREVFGDEHPKYLLALTHLATTELGRGDLDAAEELLLEAVSTGERVLGRDARVALFLRELAKLRAMRGERGEAVGLLRDVLEIQERELGDRHGQWGITALLLAGLVGPEEEPGALRSAIPALEAGFGAESELARGGTGAARDARGRASVAARSNGFSSCSPTTSARPLRSGVPALPPGPKVPAGCDRYAHANHTAHDRCAPLPDPPRRGPDRMGRRRRGRSGGRLHPPPGRGRRGLERRRRARPRRLLSSRRDPARGPHRRRQVPSSSSAMRDTTSCSTSTWPCGT